MTEQTKAWLVQGKITCPDVAQMWGRNIGDAEFRLLDHPDNPGSSADFPSKESAIDWAKAKGLAVVDMTEQTKIDKACEHCGSGGVLVDAWAQWNAATQDWELAATFDHCFCPACDGETHAIDKPLTA